MSWSANTPTTCRSIARARSTPGKGSSSIARRWRTGSAAPPPSSAPCTSVCSSICKRSPKLFMDETRAPVLDPGRKRTKTGYLWAIARDDRPWAGPDPPAVVYLYAPGPRRRACHPAARRVQRRSPGRRLRGLQRARRSRPRRRSGDARLLLVATSGAASTRSPRAATPRSPRRRLARIAALYRHRAHDPRPGARAAPHRAPGPDQAARR